MTKLTTKEQVAESISNFLSEVPDLNRYKSFVDLYNAWSLTTNVLVESNELAEYAIKTLHDMTGIDKDLLKEAIEISNN